MSAPPGVALPVALERAASALPDVAEAIRPANGDPAKLLDALDGEAGARVLEWLLRHEPEAGAELATAWAEEPQRGAATLLRVSAEELPKAARKALRRVHHRLRSRGVEVGEQPARVVATLPPIENRLHAALVSALDPRGTGAAYLVQPNPAGGARLFELMLDEERGVVSLEVYAAGRSKVRKFVREFTQHPQLPAVEAPPEAVRALVERIAAEQPADRALPRGFAEWRTSVAAPPEGTRTPGEIAREALADDANADALARVVDRLRKAELGPWPPGAAALREVAEKISEIAKGRIIVSGMRRREQADQLIEQALADVFADRFAAATARRFEESAYVLWKSEREDRARDCLAAARAFRTMRPAENPVARAMLEVALAPVLAGLEEDQRREEESSLLVKP